MPLPDDATLRELLAHAAPGPWMAYAWDDTADVEDADGGHFAEVVPSVPARARSTGDLAALAPALAAEVIALRERVTTGDRLLCARVVYLADDRALVDATPEQAMDAVKALRGRAEIALLGRATAERGRDAETNNAMRAEAELAAVTAERDAAVARADRAEVALSTLQRVARECLDARDVLYALREADAEGHGRGEAIAATQRYDAALVALRNLAGEG